MKKLMTVFLAVAGVLAAETVEEAFTEMKAELKEKRIMVLKHVKAKSEGKYLYNAITDYVEQYKKDVDWLKTQAAPELAEQLEKTEECLLPVAEPVYNSGKFYKYISENAKQVTENARSDLEFIAFNTYSKYFSFFLDFLTVMSKSDDDLARVYLNFKYNENKDLKLFFSIPEKFLPFSESVKSLIGEKSTAREIIKAKEPAVKQAMFEKQNKNKQNKQTQNAKKAKRIALPQQTTRRKSLGLP